MCAAAHAEITGINEALEAMEKTGDVSENGLKMMCEMLVDVKCSLKEAVEQGYGPILEKKHKIAKTIFERLAAWLAKTPNHWTRIDPYVKAMPEGIQYCFVDAVIETTEEEKHIELWQQSRLSKDLKLYMGLVLAGLGKEDMQEQLLKDAAPGTLIWLPLYEKALLSGHETLIALAQKRILEIVEPGQATDAVTQPSQGEMQDIITNWLLWQLQKKPAESKAILGALLQKQSDPSWIGYLLRVYPKLSSESKAKVLEWLAKQNPDYALPEIFQCLKQWGYTREPELTSHFFNQPFLKQVNPLPGLCGRKPEEYEVLIQAKQINFNGIIAGYLSIRHTSKEALLASNVWTQTNVYGYLGHSRVASTYLIPKYDGFAYLKTATYSCGEITNTVLEYRHLQTGMEFVFIPGGTFTMGSPSTEAGQDSNETQHQVTLSPYLMSKTEVTQDVWEKIMGRNPSNFKGPDRPVECVSWHDCMTFCEKTGLTLPTEAQWEFACRAGTQSAYYFGENSEAIADYAWHDENAGRQTHPVQQKKPNAYGLYDTYGNVWEWCQDWYGPYPTDPVVNPVGPNRTFDRVLRGGSWGYSLATCRSADRSYWNPEGKDYDLGFRLCFGLSKSDQ